MSKMVGVNGRILLRKRKRKLPASFLTPKALVIKAKLNGQPDNVSRVVGLTLDDFLSNCTQVLKLNSAARKLYLSDGSLVTSIDQLEDNCEVFVSQGEPFIDTRKLMKDTMAAKEMSFWGLNGLYLPKSKPTNPSSNREIEQLNKARRILTFGNGDSFLTDGFEIISDLKNMEEFLSLCDAKHSFNGHSKKVFSVSGSEIMDLSKLLEEESYVWNPHSQSSALGPVWVSPRDDIDGSAIYQYFRQVTDAIILQLRKEKNYLAELKAMSNGDLDNVRTSSIKSFSKKELEVRKHNSEKKVSKMESDRDRFQARLDNLSEYSVKETTNESRQTESNYAKGSKGLRLKVYTNGQSESKRFTFFFNLEQAKKGINDDSILFNRLLDDLSKNVHLTKANDHSKGILARRLFTNEGVEIKDVSTLVYDQVVCVSYGDNWIDPKSFCVAGTVHFMDENLSERSGDIEKLKYFEVSRNATQEDRLYDLPVLRNKKEPGSYLMVSVSINEKGCNMSSLETWCFTKSGRIFLKRLPSLSLALCPDGKTSVNLPDHLPKSKESITAYIVQLYPNESGNPFQFWEFTSAGRLSCKGVPAMHLSYFPMRSIEVHHSFVETINNPNIFAMEVLSEPLDGHQRWGFKHLDQWKLCDMPNIDWNKAALIWPLNREGDLNSDLKWPLEGNLIPCAPSAARFNLFSDSRFPMKLNVLKNNDRRHEKAVLVTGPDLSKLVRIHRDDKYETHCSNENLLRQEFEMFLANCTGTLGLPSAARRLFTKDGTEVTVLEGLNNYDYVCVSMGELWCSPEKSLNKMQLRSYANKLTIDVERLRNFMNLYKPNADLVLGIRNISLDEESILEVQLMTDLSRKELQRIVNKDNQVPTPATATESSGDKDTHHESVHERNCDAAKLRHLKSRYGIQPIDIVETVPVKEPKKPQDMSSAVNMQQFVYENNFILLSSNSRLSGTLALCANDVGRCVSFKKIVLMTENTRYKWIVHNSGVIESVYYRGFVLTVSCSKMLPFQDKSSSVNDGVVITLEKAVNTKYGNSIQRFNVVPRIGLIYPFHTNQLDKSITSAILSSICTKFVCAKAVNQQGFVVEMKRATDSETKKFPICLSCVSILNGRFPLSPMDNVRDTFVCSYSGGFKVIRNIDLSPENADASYQFYIKKLSDTKEQLTVKPCKNRIGATLTKNIKVLLYRNGQGRLNSSQMVTGKSINQIMEMATGLFNLQRPVRILYTECGDAIVDDLSFSNIMCNTVLEVSARPSVTRRMIMPPVVTEEGKDETLDVSLAEDGTYFLVKLGDQLPDTLFSIEIFISSVDGIRQFHKENQVANLYFLINYEVFNNQINSDLFRLDTDFESEVTELTVRSSLVAMGRLFTEDMSVLRMQLISATVDTATSGDDDVKLDIKSIIGFADVSLTKIADRLSHKDEAPITENIVCPLISTETFQPTSASITVEVSLKILEDNAEKKTEDFVSVDSESIILQPNYMPDNKPIELWASIGEPFYFPSEGEGKSPRKTKLDQLKLEIYNKKFLLRTIKGERLKRLESGTLEPTGDGKNPVMIKGNWMFPSTQEQELIKDIKVLERSLAAKKSQTTTANNTMVSGNLYSQKHMKNCLVYLNGDTENRALSAWGETIYEIMQNAAALLQMKKKPKYLFRSDGHEVTSMDDILPGMRLALSNHATFISAQDSRLQCEIKANWGRARSKYGERSTELQIRHRPITVIDVDPFEPPDMMRPREVPSQDSKTFKIFENGQPSSSAVSITGNSFSNLLKKAAETLRLAAPVKCFYTLEGKRIGNFKEILNDDILAASVTGKGFFKNEEN